MPLQANLGEQNSVLFLDMNCSWRKLKQWVFLFGCLFVSIFHTYLKVIENSFIWTEDQLAIQQVVKNKMWNANKEKVREMNAESEDRLAIHALDNAREFQCKQELVRQLHVCDSST
jgi:hypothetical protein